MTRPPRMVEAWAPGLPVTQGSKNVDRAGRMYDVKHRQLRAWRSTICYHLFAASQSRPRAVGPTPAARVLLASSTPASVRLWFLLPRPASHLRADGSLTPSAPLWPLHRMDLDKLTRAAFDAITEATMWGDDGQAVMLTASKSYATTPTPQPGTFADGRDGKCGARPGGQHPRPTRQGGPAVTATSVAPVCGDRRGTLAGAIRHTKARQPRCPDCRQAATDYQRARRRSDPSAAEQARRETAITRAATWLLIAAHRDEYDALLAQAREATP